MKTIVIFRDIDTMFIFENGDGDIFFEHRVWTGSYLNKKIGKFFEEDRKYHIDSRSKNIARIYNVENK